MKAIIKTQGRQFIVNVGDVISVNRYSDTKPGDIITISHVLAIFKKIDTEFGKPFLDGASVQAKILNNKRDKKIFIYKKKRRKGYERKKGHRQEISLIKITSIKTQ